MYYQNNNTLSKILHHIRQTDKNRNFFLFIIIGLLLILPTTAHAQTIDLNKGDRVKLSAPTISQSTIIGTVSGVSPSVIVLATKDSTFYIPHSSVKQLAISKGKKRNIGRGLLIGAVTGGVTFGLMSVTSNSSCEGICSRYGFSNSEAFGIGATFGVLTGGVIGAIIGTRRTDQWKQVALKVSIGLVPSLTEKLAANPAVSLRIPLSKRR